MNLFPTVVSSLYFRLIVWFSRIHRFVLGMSGGRFMHTLRGLDMLLLSTTGRRTGRSRGTPLLYIMREGQYYCVASFGGNERHPEWFLNLAADPEVELLVRRRWVAAMARVTVGRERLTAWTELVAYYPHFAEYQGRTRRTIPVVRFDPV